MKTSIFDLFKPGIGPSSSHTTGPMRAARAFAAELESKGLLMEVTAIRVELYGSLALTGFGHGTVRAVTLGLAGVRPETATAGEIELITNSVAASGRLALPGAREIPFSEAEDIVLLGDRVLPEHANGMRFLARGAEGEELLQADFYSIGGGFIVRGGEEPVAAAGMAHLPHPFSSADELLQHAAETGVPIWRMMLENESVFRDAASVRSGVLALWQEMKSCMERGLEAQGTLPGSLKLPRRAARLYAKLKVRPHGDPLAAMDWVNVYAMAVNEENAAGGRVVTAPTNGAAGVFPAVLRYYEEFIDGADDEGVIRFFLTAGAIGILYKENASISGAEVGCQGEVGVACSMAAAGLVAAMGGSAEQAEKAAEIGMEHHLGMTCDPIAGLVQIPCIERNAIGAVKAINAARLAMQEADGHTVSLDQVIRTMFETGKDMQARYKETSLGGLAVHVINRATIR